MPKIKTYNEIKLYINSIETGDNCKLLTSEEEFNDKLKNSSPTKIKLKIACGLCGEEYETNFPEFQKRRKLCTKCAVHKSILNKEQTINYKKICDYINLLKEDNKCVLLTTKEEFDNVIKDNTDINHIKLKLQCSCGEIYEANFNMIKRGQTKCPVCKLKNRGINKRKTLEEVKFYIENTFSENSHVKYHLISRNYEDNKTLLELIDDKGYKYRTNYCNLLKLSKDRRLLPFHKSNPYTVENIQIWLNYNCPDYKLLSNTYINAKEKLQWECPNHHIFEISFDNMMQGYRCPFCNMSNGEQHILDWIKINNIPFDYQYRIYKCRYKNPLPFDFAIFEDTEKTKLIYLIEYDGEQHYQEHCFDINNNINGKLEEVQKRDKIKDKYCRDNNIPLLRIPYWEKKNITFILDDFYNLKSA